MRILIVGGGFIGAAVAASLRERGHTAVAASRRADPPSPTRVRLDASLPDACRAAIDSVQPDGVVLVHGPSDVTWCEQNPEQAYRMHTAAAANLAGAARRTVLVSTDNVFAGTSPVNDESAPTRPANAYGRAKLAAEGELLARDPEAAVLRASLVYGWEPEGGGKWLNFFAACAHRLRRGERVEAPADLWNTPVLRDDVVRAVVALLQTPTSGVLHLGGPDRVSRADWATVIADVLGCSERLIVPVPRSESRYACRPTNSCLTGTRLAEVPGFDAASVLGVRAGARLLLSGADAAVG
jgi:dTDP-4-dehydrorhamnose reductase